MAVRKRPVRSKARAEAVETAYPIYSRNVTGHPRGQGSLDTNGTALNQTVCVCVFSTVLLSHLSLDSLCQAVA